ncbi:hypothetical protein Tco_0700275 [Tanacetum coccineum]
MFRTQTELLQTETPPTVSYKPQTEANIEQILPSPSIYQRKHRKTQKHRRAKKVTELPQTSILRGLGADEAVHKEGVTVWKGLSLLMWQSQVPRNHGGAPTQTRSERVLKQPNEPPLPEGGYTPGSDEGRLKLEELMAMCTKLSKQVLDLEKEKDAQAVEILKLKKRVESSDDDLDEKDASKQGRTSDKTKPMFKDSDFDDLDDLVDEGMSFVQDKDAENQGKIGADDTKVVKGSGDTEAVNTDGEGVSTAAPRTPPTTTTVSDDEDKEDAEVALRLQAELDEELRVERERQEEASKVAIAEMFDEVQARIDADYELAARMTQEEQEKYTIEERARTWVVTNTVYASALTKNANATIPPTPVTIHPYEYVGSSPSTSENDEDSVKGNNENNHEDEDDDMFNDGSECNDFLHQGGS